VSGQGEYAKAGVDYRQIEPFKAAMVKLGQTTLGFPNRRNVTVESHDHGAVYYYDGSYPHGWSKVIEGLGNKNWIAEWMYQHEGTGRTYYDTIGIDTALIIAHDVIAQGALPIAFLDEVAAGDSEWFMDEKRANDLATGFYAACQMCGMALPAGESPSLRYLIKAELPVRSAPSLSGCITGIIAPRSRIITGAELRAGDHILGVPSFGLHANGISLVIKRALGLPEKFLTRLPNGNTLGEEALIPACSYVGLIEALLEARVEIHALLPGTGSGIAKVAFDKRPFTYRIHSWVEVPTLFQYMRELGVTLEDCLTTFNWGIGYYLFVPPEAVDQAIAVGKTAGYDLHDLGVVEEGQRQVIFEPENLILPPPGD